MKPVTGYGVFVGPDHPPIERDTCTCGHCQRVIFTKPGTVSTVYLLFNRTRWEWEEVPGAFCRVCMRPVCLTCHADGRCTPWEKMLEVAEARERFLQAAGIRG